MTSTDAPWVADRSLSADAVRRTISSQFPWVDASTIEHLGSGWEFDVYATLDGWVFRFPRRKEYAGGFQHEDAVLGLVASVLGSLVSTPRLELRGRSGSEFPYPFTGHRMVPGIRADAAVVPLSVDLAKDLGTVLGRLHSIGAADAQAIGLEEDTEGPKEWLAETRVDAKDLVGVAPIVDVALRWLDSATLPPEYEATPVVVHNDLCPDHLLVDPTSGRLVGLIDWTDAAFGDPALDFTVLALWRGWGFVDEVLASYSPDLDTAFRRRLSFFAKVRSLHWLRSSIVEASGVDKHIQWVANAFADQS